MQRPVCVPHALAQAQLERARLDLERTEVRAPFDGRVASVAVAPGERLLVGGELLELYDTGALEVRAQIPSEHVAQLRESLRQAVNPPRVSGEPGAIHSCSAGAGGL